MDITCEIVTEGITPVADVPVSLMSIAAGGSHQQFEGFSDANGAIKKWFSTGMDSTAQMRQVNSMNTSWRMAFNLYRNGSYVIPNVAVDVQIQEAVSLHMILQLDDNGGINLKPVVTPSLTRRHIKTISVPESSIVSEYPSSPVESDSFQKHGRKRCRDPEAATARPVRRSKRNQHQKTAQTEV
jgi:hypothetical protein